MWLVTFPAADRPLSLSLYQGSREWGGWVHRNSLQILTLIWQAMGPWSLLSFFCLSFLTCKMQLVIEATRAVVMRVRHVNLQKVLVIGPSQTSNKHCCYPHPLLSVSYSCYKNVHKPAGLQQYKFIILQFLGSEVLKSRCQQGYIPVGGFWGEYSLCSCFAQLVEVTCISWLVAPSYLFKAHHPNLCFCGHISSSDSDPLTSLLQGPVSLLGGLPIIQDNPPSQASYFNPLWKVPFTK